jgi:transcriptional regulator with XRE-family HTH domain
MKYRIKEICDEKGIKVNSLTETVGITLPALYNIVNGKMSPKMETLVKIAEALNVPLWQLFASPEEVRKETETAGNYVCPKCGAKLEIEIKEV